MENGNLGFVLVAISVALFVLTTSFTLELNQSMQSGCGSCAAPGGTCPHAGNLPWQSYLGFTVSFLVLGLGLYLILQGGKARMAALKRGRETRKLVRSLRKDERGVLGLVEESGGVMFQSELVEKSGFPKVKVSRILDRLEGKGLLERRRRGMSNVVVLRHGERK